jgi:hypothetical protein
MADYTNVIFQNRKITFDETDIKYHTVIALEDIKEGELVFMEHLAHHTETQKIVSYVKNNKILFDTLHPRTEKKYTHADRLKGDEVGLLAVKKVEKNVFRLNQGEHNEYFAIGNKISKFNHHNDNPNCNLIIQLLNHKENEIIQLCLTSVKANKDIKKGDELLIYYGKYMRFEGDDILGDGKSTYVEPTNVLNKMELKIAHQYMKKPMFHQVWNNLSVADNYWIYHYDEDSVLIGSKNGKTHPSVKL